jgi:hypothetical protein
MEYTNQDKKTVIDKCLSSQEDLQEAWEKITPTTPEEMIKFYRNTPYYIYDLTLWHYKVFQRKFDVSDKLVEPVLDYGAGIGTNLLLAWERGLRDLTYVDLKGKTWDYALWRFKKYNATITMIDSIEEYETLGMYNSLICEEVLEHIPNWEDTARMLINHMNLGAIYFIKTTFQNMNPSGKHPMHLSTKIHPRDFFKQYGKKGTYSIEW